jgi:hypothetical protein
MKLRRFEHQEGYCFVLIFESGEVKQTDLQELIDTYIGPDALFTACINPEWGCLEFKGGYG